MPLGWNAEHGPGILIPDLIVAFDVDVDDAIAQGGYDVNNRGKPPDFVLEVASRNTARNDETNKRDSYAAYGVTEYWRFDPNGLFYRADSPVTASPTGRTIPSLLPKWVKGCFGGSARL